LPKYKIPARAVLNVGSTFHRVSSSTLPLPVLGKSPLPDLFTVAEENKGKKLINSMLGIDGYTPGFTWQWVDKNTPLTVLPH
jgi:hypothetical protein